MTRQQITRTVHTSLTRTGRAARWLTIYTLCWVASAQADLMRPAVSIRDQSTGRVVYQSATNPALPAIKLVCGVGLILLVVKLAVDIFYWTT